MSNQQRKIGGSSKVFGRGDVDDEAVRASAAGTTTASLGRLTTFDADIPWLLLMAERQMPLLYKRFPHIAGYSKVVGSTRLQQQQQHKTLAPCLPVPYQQDQYCCRAEQGFYKSAKMFLFLTSLMDKQSIPFLSIELYYNKTAMSSYRSDRGGYNFDDYANGE